jgi:hypothetical protein
MSRHPPGDDAMGMTLGTEILLLDDVAASLQAMAAHAVVYDDEVVLWLADQVERVADRSQELADAEAAIAFLDHHPA